MKKILALRDLAMKHWMVSGGVVLAMIIAIMLVLFLPRDARLTFSDDGISAGLGSRGYKISGTNLRIYQSGKYYLTGECVDDAVGCTVTVEENLDDVTLVFDNLHLASSYGAPILIRKKSNVMIELVGKSSLVDKEQKDGAAIKIKNKTDVRFVGEGFLSINGETKNGIKSGTESMISIEGGIYNIVAVNDAIHSSDRVSILGGDLTIEAGDDAVHADKNLTLGTYDSEFDLTMNIKRSNEGIESEKVFILSGDIYVMADDDGINAGDGTGSDDGNANAAVQDGNDIVVQDNDATMQSDDVTTQDSDATQDALTDASTPCSANNQQVVAKKAEGMGPSIWIYGGKLYIDASGDGMDANGNIYFYGGQTEVWGQEQGGLDEAIDHAAGLIIENGEFFAGESDGSEVIHEYITRMNQGFIYMRSEINAGDKIDVINANGEVVYSVTAPRKLGYIMYTSPKIPADVTTQSSEGWHFVKHAKTEEVGKVDVDDQFFSEYAEMATMGEKENVVIVMNDARPNEYGAVKVVKGPNNIYYMQYASIEARDVAIAELTADGVDSVEQNIMLEVLEEASVMDTEYNSWGVKAIGLDRGINFVNNMNDAPSVKVAVIDTGLDRDLFVQNYPDKNLTVYDVESNSEDTMYDLHSHGTHVTGTVAEATPNNVEILAIRASCNPDMDTYCSGAGSFYLDDLEVALAYATAKNADIVNMSLGTYGNSESLEQIVEEAMRAGLVIAAATGNDNRGNVMYPAGYDTTIAIASVDSGFNKSSFSNYGEEVEFTAPGTAIASINGVKSGTSMAAPHAAAAMAILKSFNKNLTIDGVRELLKRQAADLGEEGRDVYYGYGVINFLVAEFCEEGVTCDEYGVFQGETEFAIEFENKAGDMATLGLEADEMIVAAAKPVVVFSENVDGSLTRMEAMLGEEAEANEGTIMVFLYSLNETMSKVYIALKGDVDMNAAVTSRDSMLLNYAILSEINSRYRALGEMAQIVADIDGNGAMTSRDLMLLDYALLSVENTRHRDLAW